MRYVKFAICAAMGFGTLQGCRARSHWTFKSGPAPVGATLKPPTTPQETREQKEYREMTGQPMPEQKPPHNEKQILTQWAADLGRERAKVWQELFDLPTLRFTIAWGAVTYRLWFPKGRADPVYLWTMGSVLVGGKPINRPKEFEGYLVKFTQQKKRLKCQWYLRLVDGHWKHKPSTGTFASVFEARDPLWDSVYEQTQRVPIKDSEWSKAADDYQAHEILAAYAINYHWDHLYAEVAGPGIRFQQTFLRIESGDLNLDGDPDYHDAQLPIMKEEFATQ